MLRDRAEAKVDVAAVRLHVDRHRTEILQHHAAVVVTGPAVATMLISCMLCTSWVCWFASGSPAIRGTRIAGMSGVHCTLSHWKAFTQMLSVWPRDSGLLHQESERSSKCDWRSGQRQSLQQMAKAAAVYSIIWMQSSRPLRDSRSQPLGLCGYMIARSSSFRRSDTESNFADKSYRTLW